MVNELEFVAGAILPLQFDVPQPTDHVATVISGLPVGVTVSGLANPPQLADDGTYFQVVDADALRSGEISLNISEGFIGDIELRVETYSGDPENLSQSESSYRFDVALTADAVLYAESSNLDVLEVNGQIEQGLVPVDVIINPIVAESSTVTVTGVPQGATLIGADGQVVTANAQGVYVIESRQFQGLKVDTGNISSDFQIEVHVTGELDGEAFAIEKTVHIDVASFETAENGDVIFRVEGKIEDYTIERVGNSFEITNNSNPDEVTRISMTDIEHLRFDDAFVSTADYTKSIDASGLLGQISNEDFSNALVVVTGLVDGSIIDGAINLGNGAYGIFASEIESGHVNLDLPTISGSKSTSVGISLSAYVVTEEQATILGVQARAYGYASAQASVEAGASASFAIGPNGVSAQASVSASAVAVATAGGSVGIDGVGSLSAEATAEASVGAEAGVGLEASDAGVSINAQISFEASVSVSGTLGVESEILDSSASATATVGVTARAGVGGDVSLSWGDGSYGASGSGGAYAGTAATAGLAGEASVGGVTYGGSGGVSAGLQIGAEGSAHAGYEDGTIGFGATGGAAALVGIDVDFYVEIDTNAVADNGVLIAKGVISVINAIDGGYISISDALNFYDANVDDLVSGGISDASNWAKNSAGKFVSSIRGGK